MSNHRYEITASCYDRKGNLLSIASNSYKKSHPLQSYFAKQVGKDPCIYLHAEIAAILKAKKKQIQLIKICRIDMAGRLRLARPCPICVEAIKAFGIEEVQYSTNESAWATILTRYLK